MAKEQLQWNEFAWQGVSLRVPEDWNLGRVDGNRESGYARLDDPEIVRAEIEWRAARRQVAESVSDLVERYLQSLGKKAGKAGMSFTVQRRAHFLREKRWLGETDHELFTWEADYRAYNLALKTGGNRIVLVRVLSRLGEELGSVGEQVFASLEDRYADEEWPWAVYGLRFSMPSKFKLESHELRSGHIQLTFEQGKEICRVQRLSLAQTLLKGAELSEWYPFFFRKQLRDVLVETAQLEVKGHRGLQVSGRPRSRWRQVMRPLPLVNPRPRLYVDTRVWHCEQANKICIVDHLYRGKGGSGGLAARIADGYHCHEETAEAQPRGHAQLAARSQ